MLLEIVAFSTLVLLFETPPQVRLQISFDSLPKSERNATSPIYDAGPVWPEDYEVATRETVQIVSFEDCGVRLDRIVARCQLPVDSDVILHDFVIAYATPGDTYFLGLHELVVSDDDWATTQTVWSSLDAMRAAEADPSFKRGAQLRCDPILLDHRLGGESCDLLFALSGNLVDVSVDSPCDFIRGDTATIKVKDRESLPHPFIREIRFSDPGVPGSSPYYLHFPGPSNHPVFVRRRDAEARKPNSP